MSNHNRILIVEDDHIGQVVLTGMLKNLGYAADVASSGHEALEISSENQYAIIFMDFLMPGMDGLETTRKIRRLEIEGNNSSKTHIIALTAKNLAGDKEKCLEAGMDDYLPKPLKMEQLKEVLHKYLD